MNSTTIKMNLSENENLLKSKIGESFDIKYRHLTIPAINYSEAFVVYVSGMVDTRLIDETILEPLMKLTSLLKDNTPVYGEQLMQELMRQGVFTSLANIANRWEEICDAVIIGDTVLFIDQCDFALILSTSKYETRAVTEPNTESEIRGPREGFIESIQTNTSMIRRRIKDPGLRFEMKKLGKKTKTVVLLAYIEGLVDESLLNEVRSRLNKIKTDSILASSYIEEMIEDNPYSPFPQIANTERPDKACAAILEGRIVILVDNTPFALIVPTVFWQFLLSSGDYYERYIISTFIRWVRVLALFLSISLSSLYVLLTSFHQEMIPTVLALKVAADRNGVPFPAVIEAFMMEIVMEIMKEAGLRLPKPIGQAVSIVGTLVIGQAAVSAGLVGPLLVIVIAIAAISSFAIPAYNLSSALRLIRFPLLIATSFFGLLGFLAGIIVIFLHLMSMRSFGTPFLSPLIPYDKSGMKDLFVRAPIWKMLFRPSIARPKDRKRQSSFLRPKPPSSK